MSICERVCVSVCLLLLLLCVRLALKWKRGAAIHDTQALRAATGMNSRPALAPAL